jgi:predicted nucleic acid-binding protein
MGSRDKIILDTNIIIYLLNGAEDLAESLHGREVAFASISEVELLSFSKIRTKEEKQIRSFLGDCFLLEMDSRVRQIAIEIKKRYNLKLADAIIAGTAFVHNYQLVTADKIFLKVDGLFVTIYEP